jgi:hypothetical protein
VKKSQPAVKKFLIHPILPLNAENFGKLRQSSTLAMTTVTDLPEGYLFAIPFISTKVKGDIRDVIVIGE